MYPLPDLDHIVKFSNIGKCKSSLHMAYNLTFGTDLYGIYLSLYYILKFWYIIVIQEGPVLLFFPFFFGYLNIDLIDLLER